MLIELRCPNCPCRFCAPADMSCDRILDRMTEEGPWYALGPGQTFKEMVSAAVASRGRILCPECRCPLVVSREGLSGAKRGLLLPQWGMLLGMAGGAAVSGGGVFALHQGVSSGVPYNHLGLFISDIALGVLFGATFGVMLGLWAVEKFGGCRVPPVCRVNRPRVSQAFQPDSSAAAGREARSADVTSPSGWNA